MQFKHLAIWISTILLIVGLGLSSCGGDDSSSGETPTGTTDQGTTTDGTTTDGTTDQGGTDEGQTSGAPDPVNPCEKGSQCHNGKCCTCAPSVDCEAGIDNTLSGLAQLANGALKGSIDDGSVNIITEFVGDWKSGNEFTMNMYTGDLTADSAAAECDITEATCDWDIAPAAFNPDCTPLISFSNAKVVDGKLTAGGPDGVFQLTVPIQDDIALALVITRARIEGDVITDADGKITSIKGILGGAVPKAALETAIDNLDPASLPVDKATIKLILDNVVKPDIDGLDADGNPGSDGVAESASVGVKFEGVPGNIAGVAVVADPGTTEGGTTTATDTTEGGTTDTDTSEGGTTDEADTTTDGGTTEGGTTGDPDTTEGGTTDGGTTEGGTGGGVDPETCTDFPTTFSEVAFRLNVLALGKSGAASEGLDVDGICTAPPVEGQCIAE